MTEKEKQQFEKKVRHLMIDKGVKQRDITEALNKMRRDIGKREVTEDFVSKMILGVKDPTVELLIAMSKCFKVSVDELIKAK